MLFIRAGKTHDAAARLGKVIIFLRECPFYNFVLGWLDLGWVIIIEIYYGQLIRVKFSVLSNKIKCNYFLNL